MMTEIEKLRKLIECMEEEIMLLDRLEIQRFNLLNSKIEELTDRVKALEEQDNNQ